jgi:hypothetical protein
MRALHGPIEEEFDMKGIQRCALWSVLMVASGLGFADPAPAPAVPAGGPVRGTVRELSGSTLTVAGADGTTTKVLLAPDTVISAQQKASFADIKPHDFVASAGVLGADGKTHAQEVRIFPESMRGVGEGHRPMALPNQTMTNATVASVSSAGGAAAPATMTNATVSTIAGGVLNTAYPGGSTAIVVDPGTPIWRVQTVDKSRLIPGAAILVFAVKGADGALSARYVSLQ